LRRCLKPSDCAQVLYIHFLATGYCFHTVNFFIGGPLHWRFVAGPTIAEDKELLSTTQNPILSELRRSKEKKLDVGGKAALEKKLEELRHTYEELKKKRYVI